MPTILETKSEEAHDLIANELEAARLRVQPISRRRLIGLVSKQCNLTPHEAEEIVETYCDEKAPYTPEFLGKEIFLPYVKLMALILSVLGVISVAWGADRWHHQLLSWPLFIIGAIAIVYGGIGLLKAIRGEQEIAIEESAVVATE